MTRVEFDTTLDEIVDTNVRMLMSTSAYHSARKQWQWTFAVFPAGFVTVSMLQRESVPSLLLLFVASCAALAVGALGFRAGRWYYERRIRYAYLSVVRDMYKGVESVRWTAEVRGEVLWAKSKYGECSFPWTRFRRIDDRPNALELWFDPGLMVIRDRAFPTAEARNAFIAAVTPLLHPDRS